MGSATPTPASLPPGLVAVLAAADVQIDGDRPWDQQLHGAAVIGAVMRRGSLGLGDTSVNGRWDCQALDACFCRLLNLQSIARSTQVARRHDAIHPEEDAAMLDPWRQYRCGYREQAADLAEAQEHKLRLICVKLELAPGQRLLDIGCGWGGLAASAARHHGEEAVGITLSRQPLSATSRQPYRSIRSRTCGLAGDSAQRIQTTSTESTALK